MNRKQMVAYAGWVLYRAVVIGGRFFGQLTLAAVKFFFRYTFR